MKIFLVQSGSSLSVGGYSHGLLRGEHPYVLVSFIDYLRSGQPTIHIPGYSKRVKLTRRKGEPKK